MYTLPVQLGSVIDLIFFPAPPAKTRFLKLFFFRTMLNLPTPPALVKKLRFIAVGTPPADWNKFSRTGLSPINPFHFI